MNKPQKKCFQCGKPEKAERFRFFELVWKCDLILSYKIWQGILCEECQNAFPSKIKESIGE